MNDYKLYLNSCKNGKSNNQYDKYQLEIHRTITSGGLGKSIFVTSNASSECFLRREKELNTKVLIIIDKDF